MTRTGIPESRLEAGRASLGRVWGGFGALRLCGTQARSARHRSADHGLAGGLGRDLGRGRDPALREAPRGADVPHARLVEGGARTRGASPPLGRHIRPWVLLGQTDRPTAARPCPLAMRGGRWWLESPSSLGVAAEIAAT